MKNFIGGFAVHGGSMHSTGGICQKSHRIFILINFLISNYNKNC